MHSIRVSLFLLFVLTHAITQAIPPDYKILDNKIIKEGRVDYKVDVKAMDPTMASFMENMSMVVYFNPDQIRVEFNMGLLGTSITVVNGKTNQYLTLMNMMGNKLAINEAPPEEETSWKLQPADVTKTIAGFPCRKSILKNDQVSMVYYVTDQISSPKVKTQLQLEKLDGFPLQIEMSQGGNSFFMIATKVSSEPVEQAKFSVAVPAGYELHSQEEMFQMLGGMFGAGQ